MKWSKPGPRQVHVLDDDKIKYQGYGGWEILEKLFILLVSQGENLQQIVATLFHDGLEKLWVPQWELQANWDPKEPLMQATKSMNAFGHLLHKVKTNTTSLILKVISFNLN